MPLHPEIQTICTQTLKETTGIEDIKIELQPIKTGFKGDLTWVLFPLKKHLKNSLESSAQKIAEKLKKHPLISDTEIIKGFLNLFLSDDYFLKLVEGLGTQLTKKHKNNDCLVVEYSSPNTNKPLHLGHIRNILLGWSIANIIEQAEGQKVQRVQVINDRGIHICKSMVSWIKFGNNEEPSDSEKGDKLVGKYYVLFEKKYREQVTELLQQGLTQPEAERQAPILLEAQKLLQSWEQQDPKVLALWQKMNHWVYKGFNKTYQKLGVRFDKSYFESKTYLLGKNIIQEGLEKKLFYQKKDGSIWVDLDDQKLDQKILLRADGTSVYITQDIGMAVKRYEDFSFSDMIYTVGSEQDYHFQVLFAILKKLTFPWANRLYHLSYGMVTLPQGRMKSREGTVVDADDLLTDMKKIAQKLAENLGKMEGYSQNEREKFYEKIALGALKYHILKVDPKKSILFNPQASIDFNGNTGPFIQYTYVRIQSLLKKAAQLPKIIDKTQSVQGSLRKIILNLHAFPEYIQLAAKQRNPALIANYAYEIAKEYNSFYQSHPILKATASARDLALIISEKAGEALKKSMLLLGIEMPERM